MAPVAPGTAGSLAACVVLAVIWLAGGIWTFAGWQIVLAAGVIGVSMVAVWVGPWAVAHYGKHDPQPFVLDEVAGICLTLLFQPMYPGRRELFVIAAGLAAFRIFDVWKPWPARRLEALPAGWGILMDDLAAAVYANILCQVVLRLLM
jgi:phosphatidylglycerophosphatase A